MYLFAMKIKKYLTNKKYNSIVTPTSENVVEIVAYYFIIN